MTNKEILEKAIQKANKQDVIHWDEDLYIYNGEIQDTGYLLIFNHDFAKALWGDDSIKETNKYYGDIKWQYHLQQMVVSEDPIKYLGDNT